MVEVKTAELVGPALDWAVAEADGADELKVVPWGDGKTVSCIYWLPDGGCWANHYSPSTDWSHGGPLIEKHSVWLGAPYGSRRCWDASYHTSCEAHDGDTPLIAACRAIVDAKLGDVVRVPAELVQQPTEGSGDE